MAKPGVLKTKDPDSTEPITFDWTAYLLELGDEVVIDASEFIITARNGESPSSLEASEESILEGGLRTQVYVSGGTLGAFYVLTNRITTDTTPPVIDDRSITIKVAER